MKLTKNVCCLGCFTTFLLVILSVVLIYEFGTRPHPTQIDGIPIEAWLDNAITLEGVDQGKAVVQIADMMRASIGPGAMNCGIGILGPGAVARNNQMQEDARSIGIHFDKIEPLIHKAFGSDDVVTRRAALGAMQMSLAIHGDKKSTCELFVAACKDSDFEIATGARRSLIYFLDCNPRFATDVKIDGMMEAIDAAIEDGLPVSDKLLKSIRD